MTDKLSRFPFGTYIVRPEPGQKLVLPKPNNMIGFILFQSDQDWGYAAFGGTGGGDALNFRDGRFEYADIRAVPDYGVTPYELKHNPQPTMLTAAYVGGKACLWAGTDLVASAGGTPLADKYKNPYDINLKATDKTLFFAALTPDFKADMLDDIYNTLYSFLLEQGLLMPIPKPQQVTQTIVI